MVSRRSKHYSVIRLLGSGGMAQVFLADRDGADGADGIDGAAGERRRVVLKQIHPTYAENPEFLSLFVHEARLAMQLRHRNIIHVYDFIDTPRECVLEMEYVDGCDLRTLLSNQGPLDLATALFVTSQILHALDHAHRCVGADGLPLQIVHRDVAPGNILLSRAGEVKLADFGLARSRERISRSAGLVRGTFEFMSPEQAEGGDIDRRTDLFATGAVLYAMLSGRAPFEGEGPLETLELVRNARFDPLDGVMFPRALVPLISRSLARDRNERYPSASSMREAVEQVALEANVSLNETSLAHCVARTQALVSRGSASDAPAGLGNLTRAVEWRKRRVGSIWGAVAIALGLLVAVVAFLVQSRDAPVQNAPAQRVAMVETETRTPTVAFPGASIPEPHQEPDRIRRVSKIERPYGEMVVQADPWATVRINGRVVGTTPIRDLKLPAGTYFVTLDNPETHFSKTVSVVVRGGKRSTVMERLTR